MIQTLLTNWHFMRWLRLGLGLMVAYQAIRFHDAMAGVIGAFFLLQAITNTGCCGAGGCAVPTTTAKNDNGEVEFEEVKVPANDSRKS